MALTYTDIYEKFNRSRIEKMAYDPDYSATAISSGSLTRGKRYEFITAGTAANFTNVGCTATIAIGVSFYATASVAPTAWGSATVYSGMSPEDIVEVELADCRDKFTAIAGYCQAAFDESDTQIALAMKYFTMYLLYVRDQNEKQGEGEYTVAMSILTEVWGNGVKSYIYGTPKSAETMDVKIAEITNAYDDDEDDIADLI